MVTGSPTSASPVHGIGLPRRVVLTTALSLLLMAILAPIAQFGILKGLIIPADPAATTRNIAGSLGMFEAAIAAFLIVAALDVVVAGGLFVLLRPVDRRLARLVGWLRVVYAAAFVMALLGLVEIARIVGGAGPATLQSAAFQAHVAASAGTFDATWHVALGIFGSHLIGLGGLLWRLPAPRALAGLVVLAGVGYVADALGTVLVPGYGLSVSTVTFVGEALLIAWLFQVAVIGSRLAAPVVDTTDRVIATAAS